jgi:hypothetical protein
VDRVKIGLVGYGFGGRYFPRRCRFEHDLGACDSSGHASVGVGPRGEGEAIVLRCEFVVTVEG